MIQTYTASNLQEVSGVKIDVSKGETVEYAGRAIVGLMNGLNFKWILQFMGSI